MSMAVSQPKMLIPAQTHFESLLRSTSVLNVWIAIALVKYAPPVSPIKARIPTIPCKHRPHLIALNKQSHLVCCTKSLRERDSISLALSDPNLVTRTFRDNLLSRPFGIHHHRNAAERIGHHQRRDVRSQLGVEERARMTLGFACPVLASHERHKGLPGIHGEHSDDSERRDGTEQYDGLRTFLSLGCGDRGSIDKLTMRLSAWPCWYTKVVGMVDMTFVKFLDSHVAVKKRKCAGRMNERKTRKGSKQ